jgi:hypothetical protein
MDAKICTTKEIIANETAYRNALVGITANNPGISPAKNIMCINGNLVSIASNSGYKTISKISPVRRKLYLSLIYSFKKEFFVFPLFQNVYPAIVLALNSGYVENFS